MQCSHDTSTVLNRIEQLRSENAESFQNRYRTQMILNGGVDGIYAVMAWDQGKSSSSRGKALAKQIGVDLPTVNLMASGLERAAQKIGRVPLLKPPTAEDDDVRRMYQEKIDLITQWDDDQSYEMMFPQIGRWLPGYGFTMQSIKQRKNRWGELYPVSELRDSFDVFPGYFGAQQQPTDLYISRRVPLFALKRIYPEFDWIAAENKMRDKRMGRPTVELLSRAQVGPRSRGWEGDQSGVEVIEYHADCGMHVVIPELEVQMDHIPNMLDSGPSFVFMKRFSFDKLIDQYHHIIGIQAMMAKLNMLALIGAEDGTFKETNVFGEMRSNTYKRGRRAVNEFDSNARVEKPTSENLVQTWNQVDRLERQLRIGANYDVQQDGASPNSYATGRGMIELQGAMGENVREYHLVISRGARDADAKRLELAEVLYKSSKRKFYTARGKLEEKKVGDVIKGDYRTRRIFGAMATWDDQDKVIIGLQLMQGDVFDSEEMQENMDGLTDIAQINERIKAKKAADVLYQRLAMRGDQDPRADAAMVEIMNNPKNANEILAKYFSPEEENPSAEEQEMMQQMMAMGQPGGGAPGGGMPPESISTVMSRIQSGGAPEAGVQTAGRMA